MKVKDLRDRLNELMERNPEMADFDICIGFKSRKADRRYRHDVKYERRFGRLQGVYACPLEFRKDDKVSRRYLELVSFERDYAQMAMPSSDDM